MKGEVKLKQVYRDIKLEKCLVTNAQPKSL